MEREIDNIQKKQKEINKEIRCQILQNEKRENNADARLADGT